jgi:hypothetical protein
MYYEKYIVVNFENEVKIWMYYEQYLINCRFQESFKDK